MAHLFDPDIVITPMDVISQEDFRDGVLVAMEESRTRPFQKFLVRLRLNNPRVLERVYAHAMAEAPSDIVDDEGKPNWQRFFEWLVEYLPKLLQILVMFGII